MADRTTRLSTNHPRITYEPVPATLEHDLAVFLDAEGVTTPAGWATWLANATTDDMARYQKVLAGVQVTIQPVEE